MAEIITAHVSCHDYPNPWPGDRIEDEELGMLELVAVVPAGDGFDLTYRMAKRVIFGDTFNDD